jgi:hypothetical protein
MCLLHIKELLSRWWLLALLLICQIAFGYMGSYVMSERPPALRIAVFSYDESGIYSRFMDFLAEIPELEAVETASAGEALGMAADRKALAAVIIPDGLRGRLLGDGAGSVLFYPSPGENSGLAAKEYVIAAVLKLRAEERFGAEMMALGITPPDIGRDSSPILTVSYDGPPLTFDPFAVTPGFGVPAIFMLLLAFYSASAMPGVDMKRLAARGSQALIRSYISAASALLMVFATLSAVYLAVGSALYGGAPGLDVKASFLALCAYCTAAGGAIAAFGARRHATWILMPWIVANMTIGGGIWGLSFAPGPMRPFLPVAYFIEGCAGHAGSIARLWACAAMLAAAALLALAWRGRRRRQTAA